MRTQMYTCHLSILRRSLVEEVGGFDGDFEGSQDWDLVLRVTERARKVLHVPRVLYHWRSLRLRRRRGEDAKPWAFEAGKRAVQAHCDRIGIQAEVERDLDQPGVYHLEPRLSREPRVSVVIPTNGQTREVRYEKIVAGRALRAQHRRDSTYSNYEIVCVADSSTDPRCASGSTSRRGSPTPDRLRWAFNFSAKINAGAVRTEGDHLLLVNDDIEVATGLARAPGDVLAARRDRRGRGRLLLEDGRLQHGGVIFERRPSRPPLLGLAGDAQGYANNSGDPHYLAVTGACLMTRRELFDQVGGFSTTFRSTTTMSTTA